MPKMPITNMTTFSDIVDHMRHEPDKEIRGGTTNNGNQLYVHNKTFHNILPTGVQNRANKQAQGAIWISRAINAQYPNNMSLGQRVFQHVHQNQGINLTARVFKHDLATIQQSITALTQKDTVAGNLIQANSATPLTQAMAQALLNIANDVDVAPNLRDQAATTLRTNMMALNAAAMTQLVVHANGTPNLALTNALSALRLQNQQCPFSAIDLATLTISQQGQQPLTQAKAAALLSVVRDANITPQLRDQAATTLRTNMMALNAAAREQLLTPNQDLTGALFTLRLTTGAPAFSVADLTTIAQDEFTRSFGQQTGDSFYRGNELATRLLKHGLSQLDGGAMPNLSNAMRASIQNLIQTSGVAPTRVDDTGKTVYNPAFVNSVLSSANAILGQQANVGLPPELTTFLGGISTTVTTLAAHATVPPMNQTTGHVWTGTDLLRSAVILRAICPAIAAVPGQNAAPQPQASPHQIVATALSACLQKCANTGTVFSNDSAWMNVNTGMAAVLHPQSGYNAFLAIMP